MKKIIDEAGVLGILCLLKNQNPTKVNEVAFIKRTDGKLRRMKFDFQVEGLTKGTGSPHNFGGKALVLVRDVVLNKLRSLPLDTLLILKTGERFYRVWR